MISLPTIQGSISFKIQQTGGQGIYLDPSHNITIHQNAISRNSEYGVSIQEGKNNTITFNDFITGAKVVGERLFVGGRDGCYVFTLADEKYKV